MKEFRFAVVRERTARSQLASERGQDRRRRHHRPAAHQNRNGSHVLDVSKASSHTVFTRSLTIFVDFFFERVKLKLILYLLAV